MKTLVLSLVGMAFLIGCGGPSDAEVKAQTTKEWQDRSSVPAGYQQASAAGSPAPSGPPAQSGPVNPPPGMTGR
jgi:hypothetical protein